MLVVLSSCLNILMRPVIGPITGPLLNIIRGRTVPVRTDHTGFIHRRYTYLYTTNPKHVLMDRLTLENVLKKQERNLVRVGNSVALIIHNDERELLGRVDEGDPVEVIITRDKDLIVRPSDEEFNI